MTLIFQIQFQSLPLFPNISMFYWISAISRYPTNVTASKWTNKCDSQTDWISTYNRVASRFTNTTRMWMFANLIPVILTHPGNLHTHTHTYFVSTPRLDSSRRLSVASASVQHVLLLMLYMFTTHYGDARTHCTIIFVFPDIFYLFF